MNVNLLSAYACLRNDTLLSPYDPPPPQPHHDTIAFPPLPSPTAMALRQGPLLPRSAPSGSKHWLHLMTNIPPRDGGAFDDMAVRSLQHKRKAGFFYGGVGLLKSALQKNVRRGRAEEAGEEVGMGGEGT